MGYCVSRGARQPRINAAELMDVAAAGLGFNQNPQVDNPAMQCHDRPESSRGAGLGGTGCQRPAVPLLDLHVLLGITVILA